jgi:hypothetical protein
MKLIIDRAKWIRGEGSDSSYLLRNLDNKMCCLGFYACELGIPGAQIGGVRTPTDLVPFTAKGNSTVLKDGSWLVSKMTGVLKHSWKTSEDAHKLMTINDYEIGMDSLFFLASDPIVSEADRESRIAAIFAEHGVEVEFINH